MELNQCESGVVYPTWNFSFHGTYTEFPFGTLEMQTLGSYFHNK